MAPVPIPLFVPLEQEILGQMKKNINLLKALKKHKKSLVSGLTRLEARIDDILVKWKGEPGNATSRIDISEMRVLAQEISDCLELYVIHPGQMNLWKRRGFAKKMEKLNESLQKLLNKPAEAAEQVTSQPAVQSPAPVTPKGFAAATRNILELLGRTTMEPERLKVIAIVGFSGSGKTTLAEEVFKSTIEDGYQGFRHRAWINNSKDDSETVLLEKIIQGFWPAAVEETQKSDPLVLKKRIQRELGKKRYLIVFDNMNVKDHWDWIKAVFDADTGASSSRIIVTTHRRSIAYHCEKHGDGYLYEMRAMGDKASKDISGLGDYQYTEKLLGKCGGHPLSLSSVKSNCGSNDVLTEEECEALCNNLGRYLNHAGHDDTRDFTRLRSVLMDTLISLPDSTARCCLLYLGIFPNGHPIKRNRVTRRWFAEGYAAENSFKQFIERNIVQPIGLRRKGSKESKLCNTLSILHEFVLHMSMSLDFIMPIQDQKEYQAASTSKKGKKKVQHIFVNGSDIKSSGSTDLSCVRSLTVSKEAGLGGAFSEFSKYTLLRVLDMEDCCDVNLSETHVKDICNLLNLRYLSLGTNISNLPRKFVKKLEHLQSLQLSKETVSELPVEVIGMPSLKHLIGKIKFTYDKDNDAIVQSKNSNLETIAGVEASAEEKVFLVDMMPNMEKLRKVKIWCTSKGEINKLDTLLFQAIKYYTEHDMQRSLSIDFEGLSQQDMKKLQNQDLHQFFQQLLESNKSYLSTLKLCGNLTSVPNFLPKLSGLAKLCLSLTILKQEHLTCLSEVGTLVHLILTADDIVSNPLEIPVKGFQNLESLCFKIKGSSAARLKINIIPYKIPGTEEIVLFLPKLVSLQLLCDNLPDPSGIQITQFPELQEIELHHKFIGDARISWEQEAWKHPNRPNILPLGFFDDGESTASDQPPPAPHVAYMPPVEDISERQAVDNGSILSTSMTFARKMLFKLLNLPVKVPGEAVPQNHDVQEQFNA